MDRNKFAETLLEWIKDGLEWLGVSRDILNQWDDAIFLVFIIIIAFVFAEIIHKIIVHTIMRILKRKKIIFLHSLVEYSALRKISAIIPPLLISGLLPFAFDSHSKWFSISERITWIYFFVMLIFSTNAVINSVTDTLKNKENWQNHPIKGFIQILQILFTCIIVIVIISIILNKSPAYLITGLGAFAAVLMLLFKDIILGFISGVLISKNDMIHIGDWIEVPNTGVNGIVMEVTLTTIKVQNFDNTIVTIPPYSLISNSFINWKGMIESGGRRIMQEYSIKLDYIKPCTPEFLERMKGFDADLGDYITKKQKQAAEGKVINTENPEGLTNGTIETNAGLLRAYLNIYLSKHPSINKELLIMVRILAPTENGLPFQIYCFSANKNWPSYESIMAEIMEHFLSILPAFELFPFQNASARDYIISGMMESNKIVISDIDGIPWKSFKAKDDKKE